MKEIKAFIRPKRLTDIVNKLRKEGFLGLTVFEGEGTGRYSDNRKEWSSLKLPFSHSKIAKIEIIVPDERVRFMKTAKRTIQEMELYPLVKY